MSSVDLLAEKFASYKPPEMDPVYNFFVYGETGTGKTTLVKTLKKDAVDREERVLLLNNDMGDNSILTAIHDQTPYQWLMTHTVKKYDDVRDIYKYLATQEHIFRWVVLDDTTRMAEMLLDDLNDEFADDTWGAYGALNSRFRKLLRAFRGLDVNILFLAREDQNKTPLTAAFPGKALGDGNDGSSVLHEFDHAYRAIRIPNEEQPDEFYLQTKSTEKAEAKKRDEFNILEFLETPNISQIRQKLVDSITDNMKGD